MTSPAANEWVWVVLDVDLNSPNDWIVGVYATERSAKASAYDFAVESGVDIANFTVTQTTVVP